MYQNSEWKRFFFINNETILLDLQEDDIFWVLTVPAIWDDEARQFMRKAAFLVSIYFLVNCNY